MRIPSSLLTIAFLGAISSGFVFAKSLKPALNNVIESLEQLIAIKNNIDEAPSENKEEIETEARKTALNRILELSIEEAKNLKKKLAGFDNLFGEEISLLNQHYTDTLSEYQSYYELMRQQVNQEINLEEVVKIAKKLKQWRENNYHQQINKIASFILVFQNKEMINTTEKRLAKILRDSKSIKSLLKLTKWNEADKLLNNAKISVEDSLMLNEQARNLILKGDKKNDSKIESLIKKSTQGVTDAYQNFIALSELLNNNPR